MSEPLSLGALELDALREIGNIGAGRAATALSQMLGRSVSIDVPKSSVISLEDLPKLVGGGESLVAAVYFRLFGDAPGRLVFLVDSTSLGPLLGSLMGRDMEPTFPLEPEAASALREMGNILCGGYVSAMAELVGFSMLLSVPALAVDMAASVLQSAASDAAQHGSQALLLESRLLNWGRPVPLHLFYLPEPGALESLLAGLARRTGVDPRGGRG